VESNSNQRHGIELYILGMPLRDGQPLDSQTLSLISGAALLIGESRKTTFQFLAQASEKINQDKVYLLDPEREDNLALLRNALEILKPKEYAVLFSDAGMPGFFDPGKDIIALCESLGYRLRCVPGPTSVATALALCPWNPPYLICDFLPRKSNERIAQLERLAKIQTHLVLLETPYRLRSVLEDCQKVFGPKRKAFLALNIAHPDESYVTSDLQGLLKQISSDHKNTLEPVLIIH